MHGTVLRPSLRAWWFSTGGLALVLVFVIVTTNSGHLLMPRSLLLVIVGVFAAVTLLDLLRRRNTTIVLTHDAIMQRRRFGTDMTLSRQSTHGELSRRRRGERDVLVLELRSATHPDGIRLDGSLWGPDALETIARHVGVEISDEMLRPWQHSTASAAPTQGAEGDLPPGVAGRAAPRRSGLWIGIAVAVLLFIAGASYVASQVSNVVGDSLLDLDSASGDHGPAGVSAEMERQQDALIDAVADYVDEGSWSAIADDYFECTYPEPGWRRTARVESDGGAVPDYAYGEELAEFLTDHGGRDPRIAVTPGEQPRLEVQVNLGPDDDHSSYLLVTFTDDQWSIAATSACENTG